MPKLLTDLQERILARAISMPVSEQLYLREGHVNSLNNLKKKGFINPNVYSWLNCFDVTQAGKSAFFGCHDPVFAIQDIYDNCWIIFEDREVIAKPRSEEHAKRIVKGILALRNIAEPMLRMDTPTDKARTEDQAEDIMAELGDDRLCSDAGALYGLIREARKLAA
jgi:hypothetical protein